MACISACAGAMRTFRVGYAWHAEAIHHLMDFWRLSVSCVGVTRPLHTSGTRRHHPVHQTWRKLPCKCRAQSLQP